MIFSPKSLNERIAKEYNVTFMYPFSFVIKMCYSLEVQLITALIILISTCCYYVYYSRKYRNYPQPWLKSFLLWTLLVFLCIGLHQLFEFLTLLTNNLWIYKSGLIISVSAVYFMLRSLEALANRKMASWIGLLLIGLISVQIIMAPLKFATNSFYLQHQSTFFWAALWLFLFIYWHVWAFKIYRELKENRSRKTLLIYLLTVADVSFILSAIYVLAGYFLFSINVCTDAPSIWCTFYVIQALLIPILLWRLPAAFNRDKKTKPLMFKQVLSYLLIAAIVLIFLILTLPLFDCLTWKFIFP